MWLPAHPQVLNKRDNGSGSALHTLVWVLIVSLILLIVLAITLGVRTYLRKLRAKTDVPPKFIPTEYLKQRWRKWSPRNVSYNQVNGGTNLEQRNSTQVDTSYNPHPANTQSTAQVDRHTSVRSVMTLPAYAPVPRETEQIIAREGERAGMDMVVEFPETVGEEEVRREEEMESLYQIRLARRREIAEREERRRQRREARENHDWARLEELRQQSRLRADSNAVDSAVLLAEHQSRGRDRRISQVSYADIGLARHDGTRVRPDSIDSSDDRPLLDSAASMGGSLSRPTSLFAHGRHESTSSALTISSNFSDDHVATPTTSHERSNSSPLATPSIGQNTPSTGSDDNGATIPSTEPPEYEETFSREDFRSAHPSIPDEEAPPYESTMETQPPRLPELNVLPSIEIESATPSNSVPPTPQKSNDEDVEAIGNKKNSPTASAPSSPLREHEESSPTSDNNVNTPSSSSSPSALRSSGSEHGL
ncbi:MAG: hypothetical protein M1834_007883 [Cirrosporium novae-zelandiae]|nr:MAG: hypothetical protein M1834_007883 [Cirrosporium novae-zelandiae]